MEAYRDLLELVCKVPLGSQVSSYGENSLRNQSNRAVFKGMSLCGITLL